VTRTRCVRAAALSCASLLVVLASAVALVGAQNATRDGRFLAKEDILLFGLGLHVECNELEVPDENSITACQTVPKGFATAIPTMFVAPQVPDAVLPGFGPDALILGTLRGPSFPTPIELSALPNTPFSIPPMSVPGLHSLDEIRLVVNGQVLLRGDRESALIRVIDKLLVTQVTARALTAEEERAKGLVFDHSNFQAYNFAAAFAIEDKKIPINFTVVLPKVTGADDIGTNRVSLPGIGSVPGLPSLQTVIPESLRQLSLQVPNLNVVGFTLKIPATAGQNFYVPPIPGVIVIPGDIGFLNQFFSVMLMVGNVAPPGSGLVVSDLSAEIVMPVGDDEVANSPDDPLRMGRNERGEVARTQLVTQPGPDGKLGTSDDIRTIGPGETGNAEYLVEGKREGTHIVEMRIAGTLHGLPIGPVPVTGIARGAILVRNPTFTLTFTHPEVVSAGEKYALDVTISNTSASPANLVSLNLYPRFVTGASILGEATRDIDSIAPGDSATVSFDLLAQVSGKVTAATFDADDNVSGRFTLKSSVGELGIPLSPDSLVLPKEAGAVAPTLRAAAIGLLGKAWAVATAPTAALPKDVTRFTKKIVFDRAIEVAETGFRRSLHEPVRDNAAQLLMDFMGSNFPRLPELTTPADLDGARADYRGFDELRRRSVRGDVFALAVAQQLWPDLALLGAAAFHHDFTEKVGYRPQHVSVLVTSGAGPLPVSLTLVDGQGRRVGGVDGNGKVLKEIPFSDYIPFIDPATGVAAAALAIVAAPDPGDFTVRLEHAPDAPPGATYTLSVVAPDASGHLRQAVFSGVGLADVPSVPFSAADPYRVAVQVTANGVPHEGESQAPTLTPVADLSPSIIGVVQQAASDQVCVDPGKTTGLWRPGRVIAVLFSEEVTAHSVHDRLDIAAITNYALEDNQVVSVALQPGRRIALIALRDPIGPFVPRTITISNLADLRGNVMGAETRPIESTVTDPGGVVSGRILRADGSPVPFASVRLFYPCTGGDRVVWVGISQKSADASGRYQWDYVVGGPRLLAVDPETEDSRDVQFNIARNGQKLNVDLVMLGRGTVTGRVLDEAGKLLKDTKIRVTSLTDNSAYAATTDASGRFTIDRVPVGNVFIEAVNPEVNAQFSISDVIPFAGATIDATLVLLRPDSPSQVTVKKVTLTAHVVRSDRGPAGGLPVILYYKQNSQEGVRCPGPVDECAIALGTTDGDGTYVFKDVPAGGLHVRSFDQKTLQQGDATTVVPPDTHASLTVILGAGLATVKGIVLDPDGNGVAGARVGGGYSLSVTDATGHFTLNDVPLGSHTIVAVSDALQATARTTVDLLRAGEEVPVTLVLDSLATVKGTIFRLDGNPAPNVPVYLFRLEKGSVLVVGQAISDDGGHYTMNAVPLGDYTLSAFASDFSDGNLVPVPVKFNHQVVKADVTFIGGEGGKVTGTLVDADGHTPLKGRVSISGVRPAIAGGRVVVRFDYVQNFQIVDTNLSGAFTLSGIWPGDIAVRAAGVFSPDPVSITAAMPAPTTTLQMTLKLQATSQIAGTVYQPDGVTPVGEGVLIKYKSDGVQVFCSETSNGESSCVSIPKGIQELNAVTQEDGTFLLPIVTAGPFTLTITDHLLHSARVRGTVRAGERAELTPRLLGVADVVVRVFTSDLKPVPGARVEIKPLDDPDRPVAPHDADASGIATFAGGDGLAEGKFVVLATDLLHGGASGRASGTVIAEGQTVTVDVFLYTQAGTVAGTVFRANGTTAPNAQVVIATVEGPLTFSVTDSNGAYRLDQIPVNTPFTVEVFDPITAAHGFGSGMIFLPGQEVPVNIHEDPLAMVTGTVIDSVSRTPLKGWQVTLSQQRASGRASALTTTAGVDGGFSFPGAAVGPFQLLATKDNVVGSASVSGRVDRPGQVVDVPLVATLSRPSFGSVTGVVLNSDGSPAGDAQVDICLNSCEGIFATVAADHTTAEFALEHVPLARLMAIGRTQDGLQVGKALGQITFDGETIRLVVVLAGLSQVTGTVSFADGRPARNANLVLTAGQARRQAAADDNGQFTFADVSARSFTVVATDPVSLLKGSASDLLNAGESKHVQIVLQPTGSLTADVQTESGGAAVGVIGEVVSGQRRFFAESGPNGSISFEALPTGDFKLTLEDPLGIGIARRLGTVVGPVTLGVVRLDSSRPVVASITPAPAATGISHDSSVKVVFSEPVDAASVNLSTIVVSDDSGVVAGTVALGDSDTTATFSPLATLKDQTKFSVRVTGVRDRVDHVMKTDYTSSFTTADIAPPAVTQFDPAPNASGVNIYAPIRIAFSEPIDTAKFRAPPSLVLTSPNGPVAGRLDFLFGGTVAVFTPNLPLREQTVYHLAAPAAFDLAGNVQPQAVDFDFRTPDRTPPTVASLTAANNGRVIENTVTTVVADVGTSHDVAFVDFYLNGVFSATVQAPYRFNFQAVAILGGPNSEVTVSAVATDTSGNRGIVPAVATVTIIPDTPPAITITPPPSGASAANGQRVDLIVRTADDVGVQKVSFRAKTGKPTDAASHDVVPSAPQRTDTFGFNVPNDAVPGSTIASDITVLDTKGQATTATFNVLVLDSIPPSIGVAGAASGDKVRPGQQKTVVVSVQDVGGITSVTFKAGGAAALNQTRPVDPPQTSIVTSFTFTVSGAALPPDSVTIDVSAVDRAGNAGVAPRAILPVADNVAPIVASLRTASGALQIVPGTAVEVVVTATDDIGVSRVDLIGQGAFTVQDGKQILPPLSAGTATFTIQVPPHATPGSVLTLTATAGDVAQNASSPASLALTVISSAAVTLPPSVVLDAGDAQDVTVQLSNPAPAGGTRVDFSSNAAIATVTPSITVAPGQSAGTATIAGVSTGLTTIDARIDGVVRGSMTATVTGGIVRGTVRDNELAPVPNATVAVSDAFTTITTTTDGAGQFVARGLFGPGVTIKVSKDIDPTTRLLGFATAQMNRVRGFAAADVLLIEAGVIRGTALAADGLTPAGPGVRVDLFEANQLQDPIATTFTVDQASRFEFPLVARGQYVVEISNAATGARGRASTTIAASGQEVELPISFLGRGTVTITVKDGGGAEVGGATVKLYGFTVFGSTEVVTRTTDLNGRAVFADVSMGTFRADANDPVTARGGSVSGTVESNQQQVAKEVTLASFGSIEGTVFRADGLTTVPDATVTVSGLSTMTDVDGHYAFAFVPLASVTVSVRDTATRGQGTASTTLTQQGVTKTVDVTLLPQGALAVIVKDANGNLVGNASVTVSVAFGNARDDLAGTTGPNGLAVIEHVLAGNFVVQARSGVLLGAGSGTLAANEQRQITITLEPTASITGLITAPNDAPVTEGGTVVIQGTSISTPIRPDGTYRFDGLPLKIYALTVRDVDNRTRAHSKTPIVLSTPNQVGQANLKMVGLGSINGRLLNPDGSSAQGVLVQIRALNPEFGSFAYSTTNAGGFYGAAGLAVGDVTVSAANPTLNLRAEGFATLEQDGETLTIDLLLQNNLTNLPTNRWDANNFLFDVQQDGSIRAGMNSVFGGVVSAHTWGASLLDLVIGGTPIRFNGGPFGTTEDQAREIVLRQDNVGGLNVTRKTLVPAAGYFARHLELLTNPTDQPITADVRLSSYLARAVAGGNNGTAIITTSSGDSLLDVSDPAAADRWVVIDDVNPGDPFLALSLPATAFVFDGTGAAQRAGQVSFALAEANANVAIPPQRLTYGWNAVTVQPGQTIAFMHFAAQQVGRPGALASAERLAQLPPEALAGLNADEVSAVQNFAVPQDGTSTIAPLPDVTAIVSGRVLASNGTTPVGNSVVRVRSTNPLFGRTFQTTSAADGSFTFAGALTENGTSRPVPVDPFVLQADSPVLPSLVKSPETAGQFGAGAVAAQQDVPFTNTGIAHAVVHLNGVPVAAQVSVSGMIGQAGFNYSVATGADGSFTFLLLPAGTFSFSSTVSLPLGGSKTAASVATIAAGQTTDVTIAIDTIAPQVVISARGAAVDPRSPLSVTVSGSDVGGIEQLSLQASGAATLSETRPVVPPATTRDELFSVPFATLPPNGGTVTLNASARDASGNQTNASPVVLQVLDVVAPTLLSVLPASGSISVEPASSIVLQFSEPVARASIVPASVSLSGPGGTVAADYTFNDSDRTVTMTPSQPLPLNRTFTVSVTSAVTDVAGNPLATASSTTFKTKSPDTTPPRVASIVPVNGAVNVPVGTAVDVTFTEPVDRSTITTASFRLSVNSAPISGHFTFSSADAAVRFVPDEPLPFDAIGVVELFPAIADLFENALANADGTALTAPLTFTFATGTFGITSPTQGTDVLENAPLTLEAKASGALNVASVAFTVNGQALGAIAGPPFRTTFNVGPAATTPQLTLIASGRNAAGTEVARDQLVVSVAASLRAVPRLLGVPRGGTAPLRLVLPSPLGADLELQLAAIDPSIAVPTTGLAVIPAGQTHTTVFVSGVALGATTITATSIRGVAWAVASVSDPVSKTISASAAPALLVATPGQTMGRAVALANGTQSLTVPLLSTAAGIDTTVTVTSSSPAVANVAGDVLIAQGSRTAAITITTGAPGTATLTFSVGGSTSQLTVLVGPPFTGLPPVSARPVGVVLRPAASLGRVFADMASSRGVSLPLLAATAASPTTVAVTSDNPAIAQVVGTVTVPAGSTAADVQIQTGQQGTATLTFTAAGVVRQVTIVVGTPPAGTVSPISARPVGVVLLPSPASPSAGRVFTATSAQASVGVRLLSSPAAATTPVTVTSSNPDVATVSGPVSIQAGEQIAAITLQTGAQGIATLRFVAGGETRELTVVVGTPPAGLVPAVSARPVGVVVLPQAQVGKAFSGVGGRVSVNVPMLDSPADAAMPVTVATTNTNVAAVFGTPVIAAGSMSVTLTVDGGSQGVATLTLSAGGKLVQLVIVVGTPPPGQVPTVTARIVGVQVSP
jgi:hypothetical protein